MFTSLLFSWSANQLIVSKPDFQPWPWRTIKQFKLNEVSGLYHTAIKCRTALTRFAGIISPHLKRSRSHSVQQPLYHRPGESDYIFETTANFRHNWLEHSEQALYRVSQCRKSLALSRLLVTTTIKAISAWRTWHAEAIFGEEMSATDRVWIRKVWICHFPWGFILSFSITRY